MYKVESDFEYKGYRCVVVFQELGHRCGYVGVPLNHKLAYKDMFEIDNDFDVHGGITYSDKCGNYPLNEENLLYWIGFDAAHYQDGKDLKLAIEYFPEIKESISHRINIHSEIWGEEYKDQIRTKEYMENECKELVEQIIKFDRGEENE